LNGYIRGLSYLGENQDKNQLEFRTLYVETAIKLNMQTAGKAEAFTEIRLRSGSEYHHFFSDVNIREAYIDFYARKFDLRAGKQIVSWGKADGFNPTDLITPKDYFCLSPEPDDHQIGNFILKGRYKWSSKVNTEMIFIPIYKNSVYRFDLIDMPEFVSFDTKTSTHPNLENSGFAIKQNNNFGNIDFSFSYFNGFDPLQGIDILSFSLDTFNATPELQLMLRTYREHLLGADFSLSRGNFILKGEAAYKIPFKKDDNLLYLPENELYYVLGIEKNFSNFHLILQYSGKIIPNHQHYAKPNPFNETSLSNPVAIAFMDKIMENYIGYFNQIIMSQTEDNIHIFSVRPSISIYYDNINIDLFAWYNITTKEYSILPQIRYSILDGLELKAGGQYFYGENFTQNDLISSFFNSGFISLKYSF